jgi:hypothetical protein
MNSVIPFITFLSSAYTYSLSILLIHFFTSLFSSFSSFFLFLNLFPRHFVFLFLSATHRRMANSPIEDTTDIATQPNALIIGRCVRVCLLTYYYTLIPAHIHLDAYAYTLPFIIFFIFLFIKLFSCLVIFLSFIDHSFITRLLKSLPCPPSPLFYYQFPPFSLSLYLYLISSLPTFLTFSHYFPSLFLTRSSSCSMVLDYRTVSTVHAILYYNVRHVTLK